MEGLILIVDDEPNYRLVLSEMLSAEGYEALTAGSGEEAFGIFEEHPGIDIVLTDMTMPNGNGIELLEKVKALRPEVPVIMLTAHGTIPLAVKTVKDGAFDYLTKPYRNDELIRTMAKAMEFSSLGRQNRELRAQLAERHGFGSLIGKSKAMTDLYALLEKVAPTKANVLITGESGTGKELVARAIHFNSPRRARPFVAVNCSALTPTLLESELFGHVKGAFTGADANRQGRFELADKGSLFLDEVGEMGQSAQVKLLRAIQERTIERVGAGVPIHVDVRLISATNKDLRAEIAEGNFREDLYYRLYVVHIQVPPLRDRLEDLPLLVGHFLSKYAEGGPEPITLNAEAMRVLYDHDWPGNVRELENVIERALVLSTGSVIRPDDLPDELRKPGGAGSKPKAPPGPPRPPQDAPAPVEDPPATVAEPPKGPRAAAQAGPGDAAPAAAAAPGEPEWAAAILQSYPVGTLSLNQALLAMEEGLLRKALEQEEGVHARAADRLGVKRNVFKYKWDKYAASAPDPNAEGLASLVPPGLGLFEAMERLEEAILKASLVKCDGIQARAASLLDLKRNLFLYKLRKYPQLSSWLKD
jgi:two-component system NtrC family response regulator